VLFSSARGIYLGDQRYEPLFQELERRRAVVFIHPTSSPDPSAHRLGLPDSLIDFTADTTRAVAQMHYSNRFARTPNVKYILSHAGGTIPYLAGRFAIVDEMNVIAGGENRGSAADTFRRLYWDTALAWSDPVLRMLRATAGMNRVLFGSDFPYLRRDLAVGCAGKLARTSELTDAERQLVMSGNAAQLFPRFMAHHPACIPRGFRQARARRSGASPLGFSAAGQLPSQELAEDLHPLGARSESRRRPVDAAGRKRPVGHQPLELAGAERVAQDELRQDAEAGSGNQRRQHRVAVVRTQRA
jgi:hypothetical protein